MRQYSLRRILGVCLVLLAAVPALLVAWLMGRASTNAVEDLAGTILTQVASLVQTGTQAHLRQAHDAMNGLFPARLNPLQEEQARAWLRSPAQFEAMAFALTRQSPDVSSLYFGNLRGEYFGVENTVNGVKVGIRKADGLGRNFYLARFPGDRSRLVATESANFEPRSSAWYSGALLAKDRVYSPVQISGARRQLMVSLSQPVYDVDGAAAGVFGADLYLQELADVLRTQHISSHGAAFVVDEKGALVASSAGDALVREAGARLERSSPRDSINPVIRASFSALEAIWASKRDDSVATNTALQRLPLAGDSLLMVQRPFGEALGLRWTLVVAAPESDFTGQIGQAWKVSLGVVILLVLFATGLAFLVAQGIGRRLTRLGTAAEQLGRGEVPQIDQTTRIREVRQLSAVLHDSARQLADYRVQVQAHASALHQANETLEDRVTRRTAELAASREEALAAAKAKAAFLATMSHEIRTPLNGVVGMSTLLAETPLDAEQRDYLQTIRLSSDQLLGVINDILDFSKIESGKLELESEPLALRGTVEEACDIAAPRAREKGLELIVDIPEFGVESVPAAIVGDVTRLRQVLINLINNAIKFTSAGEVTVQARLARAPEGARPAVIEFRVIDSGIGIPAQRLDALFEAFTQADTSTTRKYGGTGLGLAICKRLVGLMGGEIGVESEPGKGSTFWFTIAAPLCEIAPALGPGDASILNATRVLVVDDNTTNVRILTRQLQNWGLEVSSAESGARALQWLRQATRLPDVIITDMHMPEMDGVSLARAIKADPRWRDIPLLLLSSGFMPAGDDNARLFDARLLKPARQGQLFDTIARCVSSDHAARDGAAIMAPDIRKHLTILVADDNAVNLKVACAMLRKLGYESRTAVDGREAVEAVAHAKTTGARFAAILMDINMPDVDGLQATRQIQAAWGAHSPPIIALTAAASAEDRVRCEAAGMVDYLPKPLQVAALAQTLDRWVAPVSTEEARDPCEPAGDGATLVPAADDALMDFSRLDEFKEFDDDELTMTREVVALFIADAPQRLRAIQAATDALDAPALSRAAHALKGAAANIGAAAVQSACGTLEADAKAVVPDDAPARLVQLEDLLARTLAQLSRWA